MGIKLTTKGNYNDVKRFLKKNRKKNYRKILEAYGGAGVEALMSVTPVDTGTTKNSWTYDIEEDMDGNFTLTWRNENRTKDGIPVVILLRYGHATRNGGYVQGYDFINPAIRPIFDGFTDAVWKEVTTS